MVQVGAHSAPAARPGGFCGTFPRDGARPPLGGPGSEGGRPAPARGQLFELWLSKTESSRPMMFTP
ncbi:MAG: hypothetical protein ACRDSS_12895, partial [Actinocrinis sp.]